MFLRHVLGDMAGGCTLEVVMMMGLGREVWSRIIKLLSCCGEVPVDGPLGVVVRDRRMAGDNRDAAFCRAEARSPWWSAVVRRERRELRLGLESTRENKGRCSATLGDRSPRCRRLPTRPHPSLRL